MNLQAVTNDAPSANQHQAINQAAGAFGSRGAVDADGQLGLSIGQVPGDGAFVTGATGDNGVERGAPGVHWVGDQLDLFERDLRLVGHGGDPLAAVALS